MLIFLGLGKLEDVSPPLGSDLASSYSAGRRRVKGTNGAPRIEFI